VRILRSVRRPQCPSQAGRYLPQADYLRLSGHRNRAGARGQVSPAGQAQLRGWLAWFAGREEVTYAHPSLRPILQRTLGVPLFQEQLMRVAMVAAGFSGGQAEELRRAMGSKRSQERMRALEDELRAGMADKGIVGKRFAERLGLVSAPEHGALGIEHDAEIECILRLALGQQVGD